MFTIENLGTSDKQWDGEQWIVTEETGIPDTEDRSQLNRAWFTGPGAEQRAKEYHMWKNQQPTPNSKLAPTVTKRTEGA